MSEKSSYTTSNGYEFEHQREVLDFGELQAITKEYDITGVNAKERVESLKQLSTEGVAMFITDLNRRLQGSNDSLIHDQVMKIGDKELVNPDDRAAIFIKVVESIQNSPEDLNPARVGDALALTTVMLHPFKDGNGRTARTLGFLFRDDFDAIDAAETFDQLAESRDIARKRGGWMINGYVPKLPDGASPSNATDVEEYLGALTESTDEYLYVGPFGQAALHTEE